MTKGGFMSFYRSKFKSTKKSSSPDTPSTATTSYSETFPKLGRQRSDTEFLPISLPQTPNYYSAEPITCIAPVSPMVFPRKAVHGGDDDSCFNTKLVLMESSRRSMSHVETNLASATAFLQVKVLVTDMPGSMQILAFRCARRTYDSLEKLSSKFIAYNLKKEFDDMYGPTWHCIVGSSFGSFVTHSTGGFLYFSMDKFYVLLFKTRVKKQ